MQYMQKRFDGRRMRNVRLSGPVDIPQWQVGRMVGRSQAAISRYESGVCDPPHHVACRIAVALNVPVDVLYIPDNAEHAIAENVA